MSTKNPLIESKARPQARRPHWVITWHI